VALGEPLRALEEGQISGGTEKGISTLRYAGKFKEIIESTTRNITEDRRAFILLQAGRYQDVLDNHPAFSEACARALTHLGRPKEAIKRYPDHCNIALFSLKRYEDILARYPGVGDFRLDALYALGRLDEVMDELAPGSNIWSMVQLHRDPKALLKNPRTRSYYHADLFLQSIRELSVGNKERAREALRAIPLAEPGRFWHRDHPAQTLLLVPIMRTWLGEAGIIEQQFEYLRTGLRCAGQQVLWHDISFATGAISEREYGTQPLQTFIETRLRFVQAVRLDLLDQKSEALERYRAYLDIVWPLVDMSHLFRSFARWRVEELSGGQ
jgi:hypothetical protein